MSALQHLREVMSTTYNLIKDYDSDAVSEISTAANSSPYYDTNCIIAEDPEQERCYLVSWEDYPLDE